MRVWANVYSSSLQVAVLDEIISANVSTRLDEAGTFDLQCVVSEKVFTYLVRDNEVSIWAQEDTETPLEWMRGVIIKTRVQETGDNITVSISGRDLMEELRWKTVGLGRTYTAQTVQDIMDDLVSDVSGWTASVETAHASDIQTARFDGTKVLKAILKSADQLGLHARMGTETRVLEIGAFGDAATTELGQTIYIMHSTSSVSRELYDNDAVLLVDAISVTEDGDTLVNWAIPMGAGEGSAATTLKYTSYKILNEDGTTYQSGTTPYYPIYTRVNDASIREFYIDASAGDTEHQDTLSFKEIGPIANSTLAKQYAADALAVACIEQLKRTRTPLVSYTVSVKKVRSALRPGDKIHLSYKGMVWTANDPRATNMELTYIDVDEDLWIMGVQKSINDQGITTTLQVNTVDQHIKDDTDIIVDVLDRSEVQNLSIQTFPAWIINSSKDFIQTDTVVGGPSWKTAIFNMKIDELVTDIIKVTLQFKTETLFATATVTTAGAWTPIYNQRILKGTIYPQVISLEINGVDVTSALGGTWGPSNAAVDVELDITSYIINAVGGIYQDHSIIFSCGTVTSATENYPNYSASSTILASNGVVYCETRALVLARPITP